MKGLIKQIVIAVVTALIPVIREAITDLLEDWKNKKELSDVKDIIEDEM